MDNNNLGSNPFGENPFGDGFRADNSFGSNDTGASERPLGDVSEVEDSAVSGGSTGTTPTHPFGDNPFGENFVADDTFGNFGTKPLSEMGDGIIFDNGDNEEKVCPHCGTSMEGKETYCMICGMTVDPVFKKDYEKSKEEAQAGYYGGAGSSGGGYNGNSGGYNNNGSPASSSSYGSSKSSGGNNLSVILIAAISVIALIFAGIFLFKGLQASNAEKVVVMHRKVTSSISFDRDETFTLYAKGDKLYKVEVSVVYDTTGADDRVLMTAKNELLQYGSKTFPDQNFITTEVVEEENKLILKMVYDYLNVMDNMNYLIDHQLLTFADNKTDVDYKDFISLSDTVAVMKSQKYTEISK